MTDDPMRGSLVTGEQIIDGCCTIGPGSRRAGQAPMRQPEGANPASRRLRPSVDPPIHQPRSRESTVLIYDDPTFATPAWVWPPELVFR